MNIRKIAIISLLLFPTLSFAKTIKVGAIFDGEHKKNNEFIAKLRNSIKDVSDEKTKVIIKKLFYGKNSEATIAQKVKAASKDKSINTLLTLGPVSSAYALKLKTNKTLIAPYYYGGNANKKKNVNLISSFSSSSELKKHIERLGVTGKVLVVARNFKIFESYFKSFDTQMNKLIDYDMYFTNENKIVDLKSYQWVLVSATAFGSDAEYIQFFNRLNTLKIPSYALLGTPHLKLGALYGPSNINFEERVSRRIAINLSKLSKGEKVSSLKSSFVSYLDLSYNYDLAKEQGYKIDDSVAAPYYANSKTVKAVSSNFLLDKAIDLSIKNNLDYLVARLQSEAQTAHMKGARGKLLPQIGAEADYSQIDPDNTSALIDRPEEKSEIAVKVSQVLFSDDIWSNFTVNKYLDEKMKVNVQRIHNDLIKQVVSTYLNCVKSQKNITISEGDLKVSYENLKLAKLNLRYGKGAKQDVYRWTSQVAKDKISVDNARLNLKNLTHYLNKLIGVGLDKEYTFQSVDELESYIFRGNKNILTSIRNGSLERYVDDFISKSLENSPVIKMAKKDTQISERQLSNKTRKLFVPTASIYGGYGRVLSRGGEGSDPITISGLGTYPKSDDSYTVGVKVSLPIFTGLENISQRRAFVKKHYANIARETNTLDQNNLSVRNNIQKLLTLGREITLNKESSEAATKNLKIVQLSYKNGRSDIIKLLDAQNFHSNSHELLEASRTSLLREYVNLENITGVYSFYTEK